MSIKKRVERLEQERDQACLGLRVFQQDLDTPAVFYELAGGSQGVTSEEISLLAAQGWQVIRVEYDAPQNIRGGYPTNAY